jgi:hypothetical protein
VHPSFLSKFLAFALAAISSISSLHGEKLVHLDATTLPLGPLVTWANTGTLGGSFTREFDTPNVTTVAGVRGVTLDGNNDWFIGPVAPASITGNGSRSAYAWIFNPAIGIEETIVAWGRRGGGNGTDAGFVHGTHTVWGALGQWGDLADVGWNGAQEAGVWTCVAYSYNGATGVSSVYTNGVLSNSEINGPLNTWALSNTNGALPIVVGCQNQANGTRDNGAIPASLTIAKLQVFNHVLTPEEITATYQADATTFGPFISSFRAVNPTIYHGASTDLQWTTIGATGLSLAPATSIPAGSTSVTVSPLATTTYTLTASGPTGNVAKSTTVVVDPGIPTAIGQSVMTRQEIAVPIQINASDPNTPIAALAWSIISGPSHGTLSGTAPDLVYTPDAGYAGLDAFTFQVSDDLSNSNVATVSLTVNPPDTAPASVAATTPGILTNAVPGSFISNLTSQDPNFGETHSYQLVAGAGDTHNSWFSIVGSQLLTNHAFLADVGTTVSIRVRSTDSTGLASEHILTFAVTPAPATVVITEILYNPDNNSRAEFIELHNPTATEINLSGWQFTSGISYVFPSGSIILPGGYLVLAMDSAAFFTQFGKVPFGQFSGSLSSDGELIELRNATNLVIDQVEYRPEFPWPVSAGGAGSSMELINPALDNNLGGSWRASMPTVNFPAATYVTAAANDWRWRPGNTEASNPTTAWRANGFVEDGTWTTARAPIGFGTVTGVTINTAISGMRNIYRSVFARKTFMIEPGEITPSLTLRHTQDDGILVWINGVLVAQRNMPTTDPTISTNASTNATEGIWYDVTISNAATFLVEGTNTIAVQAFNQSLTGSDFVFDLELKRPSGSRILQPTPGAANTTAAASAAPQIRQVAHSPQQPTANDAVTVTTKVSDPQGVGSVQLHYQVVLPGSFIPARLPRPMATVLADPAGARPLNPAFESPANWTTVAMHDDGVNGDAIAADGVFSVVLPAFGHRTLVRYRITATDLQASSVRVPYPDDESLNFAFFVYNGVPDYLASTASVSPSGPGKVWPKSLLTSVPVYHWLIRPEDMLTLQAYNPSEQFPNDELDNTLAARRSEEWEGAFVYDGIVYDHVGTRLRGGNSRYGDNEGRFTYGKRHYKFAFNRGHRLQAKDQNGVPFPQKWKSLAVNKMFGNKGGNGWGMPEEIGATLWSTFGVPAANTWWFHFRVIDGAEEAPDQYNGDFWGIQQVVEEYESTFLDARKMTKGNLYKMSDWIWDAERQRRYQSPDMVRDGSEFNNIRDNLHGGQSAAWLQQFVNYEKWYRYSAVAEAIRHYDVFPYTEDIRHALKNLAWYFEPVGADPTRGLCMFLPYDWDASFGPNWNNGWEHANNALYGWDSTTSFGMPYLDKPEMKIAHRNVLREFRDLIWQTDQINSLMNDRAAVISELSKADQDRWRNAPRAAGTANDDTLVYKVQDMKNFCFTGWTGATGPTVGAGGRAAYLDGLADNADAGLLPTRPGIGYVGAANHPLNGLAFQASNFSDPQGSATFGGMQWRIGQIENPAAPAYDPAADFIMEYTPAWESGTLTTYQKLMTIPTAALKPGRTYRARVRMLDTTGRWSHWSAPYQFTTTEPPLLADLQQNLMISEIMYHPFESESHEYIELQNISPTLTLDLTDVRFTKGVDFDFMGSAITSLAPGQRVLVVKDRIAFEARYGPGLPVGGSWETTDNLSNGGEQLKLSYGFGVAIRDFIYDDASPWPLSPDGDGPSLQLAAPESAPDHSLAASWSASNTQHGSPGLPDSRFAVWLQAKGAPDSAAEVAPGLSYALSYALGGDLVPDPTKVLPTHGFTLGDDGEPRLTLTFRTRNDGTDVSYVVETSTELSQWQSDPLATEPVGQPIDNGDGTATRQVRLRTPIGNEPARFIRLKAIIAN